MIFNIRDFGAIGDGITKDTKSIQDAIDHCSNDGGGTVIIPNGNFLSGTLVVKSNVNLHLEPSGRIISSMEEQDFILPNSEDSKEQFYSVGQGKSALICARNATNISITGRGTIDGRGQYFLEQEDGISDYVLVPLGDFRPKLIDFEGCTDILVEDVTLYRASSWGLHMTGCIRVNIDRIKILGQQRGPNNDGIDPDCCKDVHISNCHIETGDDCIVIKTTKHGAENYGACENITVTNCTLMSHDSGIKIGTETHGDIRNIVFQNCVIKNSNRGIGIWVRDGGTIENLLFSNMIIETRLFSDEAEILRNPRWWGKGEPIFISAERRNGEFYPGNIRNIRFDHILSDSEGEIYLEGSEESVIDGISLRGIKHTMRKKSGYPGGVFDTQPSTRGVFSHDIPAVFCNYAKNVFIDDLEVCFEGPRNEHWTNAFYGQNIESLSLKSFRGAPAEENYSAIELNNVYDLSIENCKAKSDTKTFLDLKNVNEKEVFIFGNDFSKATNAIKCSDKINPSLFDKDNKMPQNI
jgi:polygalacturonase